MEAAGLGAKIAEIKGESAGKKPEIPVAAKVETGKVVKIEPAKVAPAKSEMTKPELVKAKGR